MNNVTRRTFLGAASAATGANLMPEPSHSTVRDDLERFPADTTPLFDAVRRLVNETPFVDTHEHFWKESVRVHSVRENDRSLPAPDFGGMLLSHYTDSDLLVSGMPESDYKQLLAWDVAPRDKWRLVAPWYARCRHTGYLQCLRETLRRLFDVDDLREDTCEYISAAIAEHTVPGFYKRVLREAANIEYAHINCLQTTLFRETEQPDLLAVDLSINTLCVPPKLDVLSELLGKAPKTLEDARRAIDVCFEKYGNKAIAIKSQCAYWRPLDFPRTTAADAAPLFRRYAASESLTEVEDQALQGHLFHYCMEKAAENRLPVKLHTGYYAGHNSMPLARVRNNLGDLCPTLLAHPKVKFVLFHIAYPYQDEAIALAKQYSNVYVDMCWTWIINPAASVRFLKEFLMAAPACKIFTFGGDFLPVEMSVGHAAIARKGITQALCELAQDKWLEEGDIPALVERIMRGNAHECFQFEGKQG